MRRIPSSEVKKEDLATPVLWGSRRYISDDAIHKFFDYLINDKMKIKHAAIKAGISKGSGYTLFKDYMNDPERKIPKSKIHFVGRAPVKTSFE